MPHLEKYDEPIHEIIESRISCRTYQDKALQKHDKARLQAFCDSVHEGLTGERIRFVLVEHDRDDLKGMELTYYGLFKNARNFIVGIIDRSDGAHVSFGYALEHVVLKATELGLGTCWFGAFNPYLVRDIAVTADRMIPAICVVGYPAESKTLKEKIARFAVRASKRKDWNYLFFQENFSIPLTRQAAGGYAVPLEYVRLAPSSGNTQPWRVIQHGDRGVYHFFKKIVNDRYEKKHLHDIDLGIAMSHFELGCAEQDLCGVWEVREHEPEDLPPRTAYIISWVGTG